MAHKQGFIKFILVQLCLDLKNVTVKISQFMNQKMFDHIFTKTVFTEGFTYSRDVLGKSANATGPKRLFGK